MKLMLKSNSDAEKQQKRALRHVVLVLYLFASLLFILLSTGCIMSSISESSDSSSESSGSSSKSSKSSSSEDKESYLRDIKQYTAVFVTTGNDIKGLAKGVTFISQKYGVTDWEAYTATYLGIGAGLAQAAISPQQVDMYISYLSRGDQQKVFAIQQGFNLVQ